MYLDAIVPNEFGIRQSCCFCLKKKSSPRVSKSKTRKLSMQWTWWQTDQLHLKWKVCPRCMAVYVQLTHSTSTSTKTKFSLFWAITAQERRLPSVCLPAWSSLAKEMLRLWADLLSTKSILSDKTLVSANNSTFFSNSFRFLNTFNWLASWNVLQKRDLSKKSKKH